MTAPLFTPLINARLRKLSAELRGEITKGNAMIANWHDDVARAKEMEERARVCHNAMNESRDSRRIGTS